VDNILPNPDLKRAGRMTDLDFIIRKQFLNTLMGRLKFTFPMDLNL
jgi:hypothetical protein